MDQFQATLNKYLQPVMDLLKNPYIIGVLSILAIVYGSLLAPALPPTIANWFNSPLFKAAFIFLILAVRNISPTVAIILTIGLIVSMQTLNRYHVFAMANDVAAQSAVQSAATPPAQRPTRPMAPVERQQLQGELHQAVADARSHPIEAMHPMNQPSWSEAAKQAKVLDPNDPTHPGWTSLDTPNVDVNIYELNPPFLRKNLPNHFGSDKGQANGKKTVQYEDLVKVGAVNGKATRYSAIHGYPVAGPTSSIEGFQVRADIEANMLNPMAAQQLPTSYDADQALPDPAAMKTDVAAKLGPMNGSDAYNGAQGLNYRSGYSRCKKATVGAEYGTANSEL